MTGDSRLRVGRWVLGSEYDSGDLLAVSPVTDGGHPVIDAEPVGTVTDAWQPAEIPDPDAAAVGDDDGPYQGRRRLTDPPRPPARLRRVAVAAVAVGGLLVGTSVLAGLLVPDRETQLSPPPTPEGVDASPDSDLSRLGNAPTASPSPSPTPSPSTPPTAPPVSSASFEAEGAGLGSHAQVVAFDGAAGGQVVRLSGNRDGTFVSFSGVTAVDSGRYELTIAYFSDQDRSGTVSVNGGSSFSVTFPSRGEGGSIGSVTVSVDLAAGDNAIDVSSSGGAPLSIDRIVVTG
jgi:hypothetical protein